MSYRRRRRRDRDRRRRRHRRANRRTGRSERERRRTRARVRRPPPNRKGVAPPGQPETLARRPASASSRVNTPARLPRRGFETSNGIARRERARARRDTRVGTARGAESPTRGETTAERRRTRLWRVGRHHVDLWRVCGGSGRTRRARFVTNDRRSPPQDGRGARFSSRIEIRSPPQGGAARRGSAEAREERSCRHRGRAVRAAVAPGAR